MSASDREPAEDPFARLGVDRGADSAELKRAYLEALEGFGAGGDRETLRQIRAAYQRARAQLRWLAPRDPGGSTAAGPPEAGDEPEPMWLARLSEVAGDQAATTDVVARAIAEHQPRAAEVALGLDDAVIAHLVRRPELAWDNLREQANRWAAIELLVARFEQALVADDPAAVAEVADPLFSRDVAADPALEDPALIVSIRAAWEGDSRLEPLEAMMTSGADTRLRAIARVARRLGPPLAELAATGRVPRSLRRLITTGPQVGTEARRVLLDALDRDLSRYPKPTLGAVDTLAVTDVHLLSLLAEIAREMLWPDDARLSELPASERDYIDAALDGADVELRGGQRPGLKLAAAAAAAAGASLVLPPPVAVLAGFTLFGAALLWSALPDPRTYALSARPQFATIAGRYGITPGHVVEWIGQRVKVRNRLGLEISLSEDVALHVFARLVRLCTLWREPS